MHHHCKIHLLMITTLDFNTFFCSVSASVLFWIVLFFYFRKYWHWWRGMFRDDEIFRCSTSAWGFLWKRFFQQQNPEHVTIKFLRICSRNSVNTNLREIDPDNGFVLWTTLHVDLFEEEHSVSVVKRASWYLCWSSESCWAGKQRRVS